MLIMAYKHELLQLQLHLNILFAHLLVTLNNSLNSVVDFVYLLTSIVICLLTNWKIAIVNNY
jgi:hypothetical protein